MITGSRLEHMLDYEPDLGDWMWVNPPNHNSRLRGKRAGCLRSDGYRIIGIGGRSYYSSHLACLWMLGRWPLDEMDHKDRDPSNDAWSNLREATSSQNKYNREPNGLRGVYRSGDDTWWVMVGRSNYLGTYTSLEAAIIARDTEAIRLGGDFAILNSKEPTT